MSEKFNGPLSAEEAAAFLRKVPFRNFVFDVDDTLYLRSDPYIRAYQKCFHSRIVNESGWPEGVDLFRISRVFVEEEYLRRVSGEIGMNEMLIRRTLRSFSECGIQLTEEEALFFEETYEKEQGSIRLIPPFEELLKEFSGSEDKVFLGVLTNGPSEHQWNKIRALGLTRWIPEKHIVVSDDIGVSKPDPGAFRIYEKRCGILPEDTIMIGDNREADIQGAEAAGWNALWVKLSDA